MAAACFVAANLNVGFVSALRVRTIGQPRRRDHSSITPIYRLTFIAVTAFIADDGSRLSPGRLLKTERTELTSKPA